MTDRGTVLVIAGVVLLAGGLGLSALAASAGSGGSPAAETATVTDQPTAGPNGTSTPRVVGDGQPGTLIGVQGSGSYTSGGYVEFVRNGTTQWRYGEADTYFDVTPLPDGRVLAAFMDHDRQQCGPYESPCPRTGFVVLDPSGESVTVEERFSFPIRTSTNSEVHDVEPLAGGGYVLTDMDRERVLIVEDGEVTWQWNASSFYEAPPDPTQRDWLHINDVDSVGDGRFLVSVRNANQLLVIERQGTGGEVVEVINRDRTDEDDGDCLRGERLYDADGDGDVRCGDPEVFREQHNPHWLGDGGVVIADSGNDRVVELHERGGRWRLAWVLTGAGGRAFEWPRDADRLPNGNTLVTDSRGRRVVEVTESGELVRSYSTGNGIVYEADPRSIGEPDGGELYGEVRRTPNGDSNGTVVDTPAVVRPDGGGGLPIVSDLASTVRAGLPWLPLWVQGPQVALTIVSLLLIGVGGVLRWRE